MKGLYFVSPESFVGKSTVLLGIARNLQAQGKKVSYFKPLGNLPTREEGLLTDEDAVSARKALGLNDPLDEMVPVVMTPDLAVLFLKSQVTDITKQVKESYEKLSSKNDIILIEGVGNFTEGKMYSLAPKDVAELLDLKVVIVARCETDILADHILEAKEVFKDRLLGFVVTGGTQACREYHHRLLIPYLTGKGINFLGAIPQDETLKSISIRELVEVLNGEILCQEDKLDELVERFLVGAMSVDNALRYFRRVINKAVITGGDRSDIQMAALETPTKVLILTGNFYPSNVVLAKAEDAGVPIVLVKQDTLTVVELVERVFGRARIREEKKIQRATTMVEEFLDLKAISKALDL